mmetsp:Transcript_2996/g.5234  ORF Transcript_2996/g.5234 Transcript_2996/m.5234 type:complete len:263 (+) Transcript_2996:1516-2304(+)
MILYQSSAAQPTTSGSSAATCGCMVCAGCVSSTSRRKASASSLRPWFLSARHSRAFAQSASMCAPSPPLSTRHSLRSMPNTATLVFCEGPRSCRSETRTICPSSFCSSETADRCRISPGVLGLCSASPVSMAEGPPAAAAAAADGPPATAARARTAALVRASAAMVASSSASKQRTRSTRTFSSRSLKRPMSSPTHWAYSSCSSSGRQRTTAPSVFTALRRTFHEVSSSSEPPPKSSSLNSSSPDPPSMSSSPPAPPSSSDP